MKQKVIIFGRGRYFRRKKDSIKGEYEIVGFIDNAVKIGSEEIDLEEQLPIYNPNDIERFRENYPIVLMSVKFFEMWKQLMELNIEEERIRFGIQFEPFFDELENIFQECNILIQKRNKQIVLSYDSRQVIVDNEEELKVFLRNIYVQRFPYIRLIADMPLKPISKRFGSERGKAIDRVYIEKFLEEHKQYIHGDVMEIAENKYTKMFGGTAINNSYALHVNGWGEGVIKGNLVTGEGIEENRVDCLICTQTIPFIYDIHNCVRNIYKMLKWDGVALITSGFIAQLSMYDYENWGEYWRFTDQSLRKLLEEYFKAENIEIITYGNMKTAMGFLYGLCAEDLTTEDFEYDDKQYALIVAAVVRKK